MVYEKGKDLADNQKSQCGQQGTGQCVPHMGSAAGQHGIQAPEDQQDQGDRKEKTGNVPDYLQKTVIQPKSSQHLPDFLAEYRHNQHQDDTDGEQNGV